MHFAQRRGDHFDVRMLGRHAIDHAKERRGVELVLRRDFGAGNAQALLQVFFVAHQHIDVLHDPADGLLSRVEAAGDFPHLLAEVQVERDDGPGGLGGLHALRR